MKTINTNELGTAKKTRQKEETFMNDEYLAPDEVCRRTTYSKQTIYNKVCDGTFKLGVHYVKPTKRKLLFKWSAIVAWLEGSGDHGQSEMCCLSDQKVEQESGKGQILPKCSRIKI
jgi:predicted DNA-binding transcriptional regulator AlpA